MTTTITPISNADAEDQVDEAVEEPSDQDASHQAAQEPVVERESPAALHFVHFGILMLR